MLTSTLLLSLLSVTPLQQVTTGYTYATRFVYQTECSVVVGYNNAPSLQQGIITSTFYCQLDYNDIDDKVFYAYAIDTQVRFYDDQGQHYNETQTRNNLNINIGSSTDIGIVPIFDFAYDELIVRYDHASQTFFEFTNTGFDEDFFTLECEYELNFTHAFVYDIPNSISSDNAYSTGYNTGYEEGWTYARDEFYDEGYTTGYNEGYTDGYTTGQHGSGEPAIIFGAILNVAMIPVNFFLAILNFEVFGINIGGFVTGLLTLAVIYIIWQLILGHGGKL